MLDTRTHHMIEPARCPYPHTIAAVARQRKRIVARHPIVWRKGSKTDVRGIDMLHRSSSKPAGRQYPEPAIAALHHAADRARGNAVCRSKGPRAPILQPRQPGCSSYPERAGMVFEKAANVVTGDRGRAVAIENAKLIAVEPRQPALGSQP